MSQPYYIKPMKRLLFHSLLFAAIYATNSVALLAQGTALEARALRENNQRLQSQLNDLLEAFNALKTELSKVQSEVRQLRAKLGARNPNLVTLSDLEELAKSVREIDRKRVQDKDLILKEMKGLLRSKPTLPKPKATDSQKGFDHTVQSGETISAIISAYNAELKRQGATKRITLKSVLTANPNLNPRTMRIGQSLFIPDPR
jgi:predicted  nucleic acid-binding Zn-ribbon protein